jgi:2'-5' RNA ligase
LIPGDKLACLLISPLESGIKFKDWPLHVTIVPWFRSRLDATTLSDEIKKGISNFSKFEFEIDDVAYFGKNQNKEVNLISSSLALNRLEQIVRQIIKANSAWIVDQTARLKHDFRPHVTVQRDQRLHKGDRIVCSRLYLIEQLGEIKQVSAWPDLSNG